MKALVTGVAGFIGSQLARQLLTLGWDVVGLDAMTDYYDPAVKRENLKRIPPGLNLVEADINTADIASLMDGVDAVFHQAGQPGVRKSWGDDFGEYVHANVLATQTLLEAASKVPTLRRFVYASSSSVYGDAERYPTVETALPQPRSPYGVTKLAAEHLCTLYAANFNVPTVSLRYFTVYGPGQRPDMAFTRFLNGAVARTPIELYGSGEQIRDFTFVADVVAANISAALSQVDPGTVLNVCGGSSVSVNEVLALIEELTGEEISVRKFATVAGDVFRTGGDNTAAKTLIDWSPQTSLRDGLAAQLEWVRTTHGGQST